ncbi:MAG: SpoIIE family protein phosphatase, partial [Tenuifilaceae bacterium]|nr:SpoIIE family protein phosphatase [Tenuifilaceae bacterium]
NQDKEQVVALPYRNNSVIISYSATFFEKEESIEYSSILEGSEDEWSKWSTKTEATHNNLREGRYTFKVKARNIYGVESPVAEYAFIIKPPYYRTLLAYLIYTILFVALIWLVVKLNTRRLIAEKDRLEQIVKERTAEIIEQKEEIEAQRDEIEHQKEEITSSIHYASRIQSAVLTPQDIVDKIFPNHFLLYLPRDIVSGDFYWITQVGNHKICAVADCTGHGVPGGFMSMLGMTFLNELINKGHELHPAKILYQLRANVISSLHQTGKSGENKDGMDIALYIINTETNILEFAGANNPLILIRNNEVMHIKGDKMPIGIHIKGEEPFTNITIELQPNDRLYTFSDGYVDQFGGSSNRKFMIKNLKELLLQIHQKPMIEQKEILLNNLIEWQGDGSRIDDIIVMGVQI